MYKLYRNLHTCNHKLYNDYGNEASTLQVWQLCTDKKSTYTDCLYEYSCEVQEERQIWMMCSSFSMCTCVLLVNRFYYGRCGEPFCVSPELLYCRQHIDSHQSNKEHQPTDEQIYSARQSSCTSDQSRKHSLILRTWLSALLLVSFIEFMIKSNCRLESCSRGTLVDNQ